MGYKTSELRLGKNDTQLDDPRAGEVALRIDSTGAIFTKPEGAEEVAVVSAPAGVDGLGGAAGQVWTANGAGEANWETNELAETSTVIFDGGTTILDLADVDIFAISVVASDPITFDFNLTEITKSARLTILIANAFGASLTWPSTIDWPGGIEPTFTSDKITKIELITYTYGTSWYGTFIQNFT